MHWVSAFQWICLNWLAQEAITSPSLSLLHYNSVGLRWQWALCNWLLGLNMQWAWWVKWQLAQYVWVWMQPGAAEREPFACSKLKQIRALGSLCVSPDRSGSDDILLLLFLCFFFVFFLMFYWDAAVSALWQLSHSEWQRVSKDRRIRTCPREECDSPNLPTTLTFPLLLILAFLFFCSHVLFPECDSWCVYIFNERQSYMWTFLHTHSCTWH